MLLSKRSHRNEKPLHHDWSIAPAHCNLRKPTRSNEDPVQPKVKKKKTWFGSSSSCPRCPQAELGRPSGQQDSASSTVRSPSSDRLQEAFCFLPLPLGQDVVPNPLGMMGLLHHSRAFSSSREPALKVKHLQPTENVPVFILHQEILIH